MFVPLQQIDEMLAGSLSQEDEDAVLAELEAITQVTDDTDTLSSFRPSSDLGASELFQGDVELPEVPSDELPEAPEKNPGLLLHLFCGTDSLLSRLRRCIVSSAD